MKKFYIEGDDEVVGALLVLVRSLVGRGISVIDVNPELTLFEKEEGGGVL